MLNIFSYKEVSYSKRMRFKMPNFYRFKVKIRALVLWNFGCHDKKPSLIHQNSQIPLLDQVWKGKYKFQLSYIKASSDFAARILEDSQHPLYEDLSKARSHIPPRAVSCCFPRRLLRIGTLFYRYCHGCWLTETLKWTTIYRRVSWIVSSFPFPNCTTSLAFIM